MKSRALIGKLLRVYFVLEICCFSVTLVQSLYQVNNPLIPKYLFHYIGYQNGIMILVYLGLLTLSLNKHIIKFKFGVPILVFFAVMLLVFRAEVFQIIAKTNPI